MRISHKLLGCFLAIALLVGVAGHIAVIQSQQALVREIGHSSVQLANSLMDEIDRDIYNWIEFLQLHVDQHTLDAEAERSSQAFAQHPDRLEHITNTDRDWKEKRDTPFIQSVLNQPLSAEFSELITYFEKRYGYPVFSEVYLTNRYGVVIASSGRTSDYLQADETWYQQAVVESNFWVGDVEYDESSNSFALDIVINLYDKAGHQTGIFKAVLNIDELIRIIQAKEAESALQSHPHESKLITRDGNMIYSSDHATPLESVPQSILSGFAKKGRGNGYFMGSGDVEGEEEELFARAVSQGYLDYEGLGWSLIIEHEKDQILLPVTELRHNILALLGFALVTASLLGVFMARSLSRPLVELSQASEAIGRGELDTQVAVQGTQEIALLASSINKMAENLQHTTVSKTYTDKIIESMQDCLVVTSPDGLIEKVNHATLELLGYDEGELIGRPISTLFAAEEQAALRERGALELVQNSSVRNIEKVYLSKTGQQIPVLFSGAVMQDKKTAIYGIVCVALDIRERKQAEQDLKESEQKLHSLTSAAQDAVIMLDNVGKVVYWNPAAQRILGYAPAEVMGKKIHQMLAPEHFHASYLRGLKRFKETGTGGALGETLELSALCKDGIEIPVELSVSATRLRGQWHAVGILRDISERKQAEAYKMKNEERLKLLLEINQKTYGLSEEELFNYLLDKAVSLTDSKIGYLHTLNEDQETLSLITWNKEVLKNCNTVTEAHYPLKDAGVWADSARLKQPVIHNDYQNLPDRKGYPEGHTHLIRHMSLPVINDDQVSIIIGVGNKETDYNDEDVAQMQLVANEVQKILLRQQTERALRKSEQRFHRVAATIPDILYSAALPEGHATYVSPSIATLLGFTPEEWLADPELWQRQIHKEDRERVWADLANVAGIQQEFVSQYRLWHKDGKTVHWFEDRASLECNRAGKAVALHGVMTDITKRKLAEDKIAHQAFHDGLTDLPNRTLMIQALDETIDQIRQLGGDAAVLFIDLDEFKLVNDTLGHAAGDELLRQTAKRLQAATRDTDIVARQGGDEFIVLLSNPGNAPNEPHFAQQAASVAHRILEGMQQPFLIGGQEAYVSASVGISLFPQDSEDTKQLIQHADNAMYRAKELGRNNFQFFSRELSERQHKKMSLATMLHKAIEASEFVLHYQPIIELATGQIIGVEALIRWEHEKNQLIPPADFLPVAEDTGLILPIGEWAVREACLQSRQWRDKGISLQVAINLSVRQMWNGDIVSQLLQIINETGVCREMLEFEVTESVMISDPDRMATIFHSFRENGLRIALDDFGTGYSSLDRLKRLPFNKLKVDRSFVDGIPDDRDDVAIVSATVQLAKSLGLLSLAEGIETPEQLHFLTQLGCDYGQGFYFSKPVAAAEIEKLVKQEQYLESCE